MRSRLVASVVTLGVITAMVTVPVTAASASGGLTTVVVGPEALLNGSTDLRLTKEYETVAPAVPGFRSPADHVYVEGPTGVGAVAAHGGSSLQLFTGSAKPNPGTNPSQVPVGSKPNLQGKEYVGRWFSGNVQPSRLTGFAYRALSPTSLAPYLSIEYFNPSATSGHQYVNLVWTPGTNGNAAAVPGAWQDYDTTTGWTTSASFVTGITPGVPMTLAAAVAALDADDDDPLLLRANVSWGDTGGGYADKSIYLDDLALTFDGTTTTYAFDTPYATPCVAPTSSWVRDAELADPTQWAVHTEYQPSVASSATASIVDGPTGAAGGQSLQLASGAGTDVPGLRGYAGKVFVDRVLPGCTVADLTDLTYRTFTATGQNGLAPYLNLDVALPGNNGGAGESSILVWSPGDGGAPAPTLDSWSTWTPFTSGTWRVVRTITGSAALTAGQYYTWAQIKLAIPNAELPRGVEIVVGDSTYQAVNGTGWSGKTLQVDSLAIGIGGTTSTFEFGGFGNCPATFDFGARIATLTADCETSTTVWVPDGWTLDGAGHSLKGLETPTTAFHGAILQNSGVLMNVRNLTVTTNKDEWDKPTKNSGGDLVGIRFLAAAGSVDHVTVDGISHGNVVPEGKGILIDNRTGAHNVQVSITGSTVVNYQKHGIDVRGAGATLELRDSTIGFGATPKGVRIDDQTASNSLVVYGATAVVTGNTIAGNDWDGTGDTTSTRDWNATGVLLYEAGSSVFSGNVVNGAGTDVGIYSYNSAATITCNVVSRTADQPGRLDVWSTGITIDGGSASLAGNTISGFRTPINGAVQAGSGGCLPATPTVTSTVTSARTATVGWSLAAPVLDPAPVSAWEVSVDGVVSTRALAPTTLALTGLAPGSHHLVAVRAINADGAGAWASSSFTTSTIPVPSAVVASTNTITTTTATVAWVLDATTGDGVVDGYEVTLDGVPVVVSAATSSRALTGLAPGTAYTAIVRAHNESGWSNPTSVSFTTVDLDRRVPGAPTVAASSVTARSASVDWGYVLPSGMSPVSSWEVSVDGVIGTNSAGVLTRSLTGLVPGTFHQVSVRAVNANGAGPWAVTSFTTATIPLPAAVSGLVAGSIARTSATVSWNADATVGDGAVDGYEITVGGAPTVVSVATLSRSLSGLVPGAAYTAILRAHNESGWSNPTSVSFTTNDLDRRTPGAPTFAVGDPDGNGVVPLAWTPNAGDSTDFPVQSWIITIDGADEAYLSGAARSYRASGLSTGRHTLTIRGVNALGGNAFAAQVIVLDSQNASLPTATLSASPSSVVPGASTTLVGRFALDGNPSTDTVVTVWARSGSSWTYLGTTVTDDNGQFAYAVRVIAATQYRAIASGLPSAYTTVTVRPSVSTKVLTSAVKKLTLVRIQATVTPKAVGATARLQKLVGKSWRTVATGRLSATSAVVLSAGTVKALSGSYRVVVSATRTSSALVSPTFAVKVKAR